MLKGHTALGSIGGVVDSSDVLKGGRVDSKDRDCAEVGEATILRADHLLVDVGTNRLNKSAGNEATFREHMLSS